MTIRQGNKIIAGNINVEDYNTLQNKPQINSVELSGNKTLEELGIQASGDYALKSTTLAGYGITDGLSTSQITNCITKISQDIKLELSEDGTLTLKAGSKVYIPNGAGVFDEVVIDKDYVPAILDASNGLYVIFYRNDKQVFGNMSINVCFSGDGSNIPVYSNMYYNIKDNVLKYCNASGPTDYLFSLPLAIINVENNKVASIDQVFNGFGFIDSTFFILPGIECLIPNGRNEDGSLNNIKIVINDIRTYNIINNPSLDFVLQINETALGIVDNRYYKNVNILPSYTSLNGWSVYYLNYDNYMYVGKQDTPWSIQKSMIFGKLSTENGRIISFEPKSPIKLADDQEVVHNIGDEEIAGVKAFKDEITAPNQVDYTNITNCLTKIPQNIKLELNNGTLTLKAGSKVYIPNGFEEDGITRKFDVKIIEEDIIYQDNYGFENKHFLFISTNNRIFAPDENICLTQETAPSDNQYIMWYDLTNNVIKWSDTTGTSWYDYNVSLPICSGYLTDVSKWSKIDNIFNGFGYIGSTVFALPNVEGLVPNGRNEDGSLNNTKITSSKVWIRDFTNQTNTNGYMCLATTGIGFNPNLKYIDEKNYLIDITNNIINNDRFEISYVSIDTTGRIIGFKPKYNLQIVDRSDTQWASTQGKPSNKYVDLTLEASGAKYIAPANGIYSLNLIINLDGRVKMFTDKMICQGSSGATINVATGSSISVQKGDTMTLIYENIGNVDWFRFVYDEGEK